MPGSLEIIWHRNQSTRSYSQWWSGLRVFARQIYQSDMWGFVEIEELVFGERSRMIDPGEKPKTSFQGQAKLYPAAIYCQN